MKLRTIIKAALHSYQKVFSVTECLIMPPTYNEDVIQGRYIWID